MLKRKMLRRGLIGIVLAGASTLLGPCMDARADWWSQAKEKVQGGVQKVQNTVQQGVDQAQRQLEEQRRRAEEAARRTAEAARARAQEAARLAQERAAEARRQAELQRQKAQEAARQAQQRAEEVRRQAEVQRQKAQEVARKAADEAKRRLEDATRMAQQKADEAKRLADQKRQQAQKAAQGTEDAARKAVDKSQQVVADQRQQASKASRAVTVPFKMDPNGRLDFPQWNPHWNLGKQLGDAGGRLANSTHTEGRNLSENFKRAHGWIYDFSIENHTDRFVQNFWIDNPTSTDDMPGVPIGPGRQQSYRESSAFGAPIIRYDNLQGQRVGVSVSKGATYQFIVENGVLKLVQQ